MKTAIALIAAFSLVPLTAQAQVAFVDAAEAVEGLVVDMRYFSEDNFVGARIDGYEAPRCLLARRAAAALAAVQRDLSPRGYGLKVFDCYRPVRAVAHFVRWARDVADVKRKADFYPDVDKRDLFRLGYIAEHSQHSTGAALDLTLVDLTADNSAAFDPAAVYADCTAAVGARAPEGSVDMGTAYDCSDPKANTAARSITPEQRRWRDLLKSAMAKQGFANYSKEWWHFSKSGVGGQAFDFPIPPATG